MYLRLSLTNHSHVPIGTENINAYFQVNGVTLVGKIEVQIIEKNSAVNKSHFAFAIC